MRGRRCLVHLKDTVVRSLVAVGNSKLVLAVDSRIGTFTAEI